VKWNFGFKSATPENSHLPEQGPSQIVLLLLTPPTDLELIEVGGVERRAA
jgi:hypothetical protein